MNKIARSNRREDVLSFAPKHARQPRGGSKVHTFTPVLLERGDAPDFVEVGEAGIAVDHAMRRQRRVQ